MKFVIDKICILFWPWFKLLLN